MERKKDGRSFCMVKGHQTGMETGKGSSNRQGIRKLVKDHQIKPSMDPITHHEFAKLDCYKGRSTELI